MKRGAPRLFFCPRPVRLRVFPAVAVLDGSMHPDLAQFKNKSDLTLSADQKLQKLNIGSWYQTLYWHETG